MQGNLSIRIYVILGLIRRTALPPPEAFYGKLNMAGLALRITLMRDQFGPSLDYKT